MPFSGLELNRFMDYATEDTLTVYVHSGDPTEGGVLGTANRITNGGGLYASGVAVPPSGWDSASGGVVTNSDDVSYGRAAGAAPGEITHYSVFRGAAFVGCNTIPPRTIRVGDTYQIAANTLSLAAR